MSDPKSSYGDPVDEPNTHQDADVVGSAHEGLAEAEAARRDLPADEQPVTSTDASSAEAAPVESVEPVGDRPAATTASDDDDDARWAAYAASADVPERPYDSAERASDEAETRAYSPAVTPSEPTVATTAAGAGAGAAAAAPTSSYAGPQPIFVQAPEAPRPRGNRGAAAAIGLLAAVVFAVLYLAATLGLDLLSGDVAVDGLLDATLSTLATAALWVPVVVFYLAFCLLGAFINRGGWGHWVVWGLLVGVASYFGHLLGQLFQAPFWMLTAREGATLLEEQVLAALAIVAFVLGRELTIWFGAWVARRGKRVTELNDEAQREYERTLEAGPQLHHG
jgi:hypothetical protein